MNPYVILFSGTKVAPDWGAPTPADMAQALSRICRFAGNGWEWFSVALHSFVVADLLPAPLKIYGLTHDGPEVVGNDVPKPIKQPATEEMEQAINVRFLASVGLPRLTPELYEILKNADSRALHGEVHTLGPVALRGDYPRDEVTEKMVMDYFRRWPVELCTARGGPVCMEFLRRYHLYLASYKQWEIRATAEVAAQFFGVKKNPLTVLGK